METFRQIALKTVMLLGLLMVLNLIYRYTQYDAEVAEGLPVWNELKTAGEADILYLGESSNITYGDLDFDKAAIHEFLQRQFPRLKVAGITQPAAHAGHYLTLLQNIPASSRVKAVVVTMNLRSFSAQWRYSKQEPALAKKMVLIGQGPALWRRYLLSMRKYYRNSELGQVELFQKAWREDRLHFPFPLPFHSVHTWDSVLALRAKNEPDLQKRQDLVLATHYVKAFAFEIDTLAHPRLDDFQAIVDLAEDRGWKLVFNLLPENTGQAEELLGDTLVRFMRQNAAFLQRRFSGGNATVLNLLDSLPSRSFLDQNWTTEHYDEAGRRMVASAVARELRQEFAGEWVEDKSAGGQAMTRFANDCEGGWKWSQMHTCVEGRARSGQKASRFGKDQPFGITWTSPVDRLDSTRFDSVVVECWVYQEDREHLASLAFEASGDSVPYLWDTLALKPRIRTAGTWEPVRLAFKLWPEFRRADLVKVYGYNPGQGLVWMDDIVIRFK